MQGTEMIPEFILAFVLHTVLDTVNVYLTKLSQTCSIRFPQIAAWQSNGARNAQIVRGWTRKHTHLTEDGYQLLNPCSHATTKPLFNGQPFCHTHPRYFLYTYVYLWSHNKTGSASQATSRHKWLSPFSARIRAEFLSRFFCAVSCGKSERVRTDIRVRPRWKFEEFFRKM